ncbi:DNA polymerase III subunit delta [Aridibaculum aurantiacum]|uniref:DNA polymerase III subunit delta n=1 Tax=Aridibaculum aurantiacum TaxID=2810307 RepID=UPI001A969D69|nr:DNA polymerase III subunit delta [Aridibaculum aurantiacum]
MSAEKILQEWKIKAYKPVYWLEGDEPYYIDQLVHYAEHNILSESEAGFNLTVFYGRDADWAAIVNACRRYPMFAERQVVLLKEAQHMKDLEKLEGYVSNPLSSTILIIAYKDKRLDGRTKFAGTIKKKGELFQSKKLYENQLPDWVKQMVQGKGYSLTPGALQLLIDHIGNDLSRLANEVDKVCINLGSKKTIDEESIERYVGISKDFNAFELQAAIAKKDMAKAIRIIQYFEANPKAAPIQMILPAMYGYFSKVYSIFGLEDTSENGVKSALFPNNFYAARDALSAAKLYGNAGVEKIILLMHQYNLRSIGVHDAGTEDADLLKEMVVKMMN